MWYQKYLDLLVVQNTILEVVSWGIILCAVCFTIVSLGYKQTKLKILVYVSLFILTEVITLAFLKNYLLATFILFIYVGAIIVLFTVVLLTNPEAANRQNLQNTDQPLVGLLLTALLGGDFLSNCWEILADHRYSLLSKTQVIPTNPENYMKFERLSEIQKSSINDLLHTAHLLTAHWDLVLMGGVLLALAMVVVMKLVGEFTVSKKNLEKTGQYTQSI